MIITRTPLRISLGGGGTDLPSFYEQAGGFIIAAAISRYIYIGINRMFEPGYFLKYSDVENVLALHEVKHPIFREVLSRHDGQGHIEIASLADVPAGTGLGSSGAFTVGLLKAMYEHKRQHPSAEALAQEACDIEINVLRRAVGKQDQYIAAIGGLTCFDFRPDGSVDIKPLVLSTGTLIDLESNLLMFFTGYSRDADRVLSDQRERSKCAETSMMQNLLFVKQLGLAAKDALESGDTRQYAALMREHWAHKQARSCGITSGPINDLHALGMANGALGGKLVGAGGGGYLLFYAEDPVRLRRAMGRAGLNELRFRFDHDGAVVMARD
ncbi:MAG TPA: galactokinase [Bryobacteraceae bacterium]|nr:galactokinase [Bryobacteraceae bacterium]